jgi:hypothetical protein
MEQPVLVRVHDVPAARLAGGQEEHDRRARPARCIGSAEGLAEETALGMGGHPEGGDGVLRAAPGGHQRMVTVLSFTISS